METIQKKFFNLLALVKYVLESKACIPFPPGNDIGPYKKPYGYELYQDQKDREDFLKLEKIIIQEVEESVKTFHYFRSKFENISKSILVLSGIKGGQHTITIEIFKILMSKLTTIGIQVRYKKIVKLDVVPNLKRHINPPGFWRGLLNFSKRTKPCELHNVAFIYEGSEISISAFVYHVDGKIAFVSFIENSIKDINGQLVFEKIEMEVDRIIRLLPITHIIGTKSCGPFGCRIFFIPINLGEF